MISQDLLDELQKLNRSDKLRVIQILAGELAAEDAPGIVPGTIYEVWSPYDASEAADTLLNMLADDRGDHG